MVIAFLWNLDAFKTCGIICCKVPSHGFMIINSVVWRTSSILVRDFLVRYCRERKKEIHKRKKERK